jgi:hypothetical protein
LTYHRTILDLREFKPYIDNIIAAADDIAKQFNLEPNHLFKKVSHNHPMAECPNSVDARFEAIPNKLIRKSRSILDPFKQMESAMEINDLILTRYITRFQPDDFLNWRKNKECIAKFLSISTTNTHLLFKDERIHFPPYYGIIFNQRDTYSVTDVKEMENWIVFMIPEHSDPLRKYEIYC